jgi:hypothetical protein
MVRFIIARVYCTIMLNNCMLEKLEVEHSRNKDGIRKRIEQVIKYWSDCFEEMMT